MYNLPKNNSFILIPIKLVGNKICLILLVISVG